VCKKADVDMSKRAGELSDEEVSLLQKKPFSKYLFITIQFCLD